jgi:hypothetical protein
VTGTTKRWLSTGKENGVIKKAKPLGEEMEPVAVSTRSAGEYQS